LAKKPPGANVAYLLGHVFNPPGPRRRGRRVDPRNAPHHVAPRALYVDSAEDGEEALRLTAIHDYAVILLDLMMPRVDGFAFLEQFHSDARDRVPVIFVVTAFDDLVFERIPAHHAHAIIRKPFDVLRLATTIREVATAIHETRKVTRDVPLMAEERRAL